MRNLSLQQHLDAGQLPMFMTANEIQSHYDVDEEKYQKGDKGPEDIWKRSLKESKTRYDNKPSRYETFKKEGVKTPVTLGTVMGEPTIYDGHHRVASMLKIDPNRLLPVEHEK